MTQVLGFGGYVPERIMTNDDWAAIVDTSDEWITSRTGIKERRFAADDEATLDLAAKAAELCNRVPASPRTTPVRSSSPPPPFHWRCGKPEMPGKSLTAFGAGFHWAAAVLQF